SALSTTPLATTTAAAVVTLAAPKIPLRGLIDMQDISWHNTDNAQPAFDISNAQMFPGILGGIVINATWSQMQPTAGGAVNFSATDAALAQIAAYNASNASAPLGVKLRIYGGSNAPPWAKSLGGAPITIYRNPAGCSGQTDSCPLTVGPFWTTQYISDWRAFQAAAAAKYDTNPLIVAVAVTSCAAQTDEPFVTSSGPISKANLGAAGYSDTAEQNCLMNATDDYKAWTNTDIDFTFNSYNKFTGGLDSSFTQSVMTNCRNEAGSRCVLDNHALQTPLTNDVQVYNDIAAIGGLINFQTQSPAAMGCIWPETITQGLILGARAIEIWPAKNFQGFDTLTVSEMQQLRNQFFQPVAAPTPVPSPLPDPCKGFN
ncbi:MAG TPA: hypothetical protein VIJ64_07385, partial [Candidatus Lustribacter sp.]